MFKNIKNNKNKKTKKINMVEIPIQELQMRIKIDHLKQKNTSVLHRSKLIILIQTHKYVNELKYIPYIHCNRPKLKKTLLKNKSL